METPLHVKESGNAMETPFSSKRNGVEMEVWPPLDLHYVPFDNPPLLTLFLSPTTTTMSSTLSHSMEDDLIDNAFLSMMLQLLQESQPELVPNKPRQSRNISREEGTRNCRNYY